MTNGFYTVRSRFRCPSYLVLVDLKLSLLFYLIRSVEDPGIDPGTSRMLSERSTI